MWASVHSKQILLPKSLSLKVLFLVSLPESYPLQKVTATTETRTETEESIGDDKGNFEKQRWHAMSIKLPKSKKDSLNSGGIYWSEPGWSFFVVVIAWGFESVSLIAFHRCHSDPSPTISHGLLRSILTGLLPSTLAHYHLFPKGPWDPALQPTPSLSPLALAHSTPDTQTSGMVCRHTKQALSLEILLHVSSAWIALAADPSVTSHLCPGVTLPSRPTLIIL